MTQSFGKMKQWKLTISSACNWPYEYQSSLWGGWTMLLQSQLKSVLHLWWWCTYQRVKPSLYFKPHNVQKSYNHEKAIWKGLCTTHLYPINSLFWNCLLADFPYIHKKGTFCTFVYFATKYTSSVWKRMYTDAHCRTQFLCC